MKQKNNQFPTCQLMSFANDTFMRIIEKGLFTPSMGIRFISYLGRSVSLELVRLKLRDKYPITNKKRKPIENGYWLDISLGDDGEDGDSESFGSNGIFPKELTVMPEFNDDNNKKILNKLIDTLTNEERMILFEHYKVVEPTKKLVSRQAIDQKRYKIERKLRLRLKEVQNKGEL